MICDDAPKMLFTSVSATAVYCDVTFASCTVVSVSLR